MPPNSVPSADGRHLRVVRGKEAAIDALLALYTEGRPYPTFADIADRAGISERTLFRYFGSYDDFIAESARTLFPKIRKYFSIEPVGDDLHARLVALAELRCKFVKQYGAMIRSVDVLAAEWKAAKSLSDQREQLLADQLSSWLGTDRESISEDTFALLQNLYGWRSMDRMSGAVGKRAPDLLADAAMAIINATVLR